MNRKILKFNSLVAGSLFLFFGILSYYNAGWFQRLEAPLYDAGAALRMQRAAPDESNIVLVELEQKDLGGPGSTRIDGESLGQAVKLLSMGKAKVIGIDLPLGKYDADRGLGDLRRIQEKVKNYGHGRQKACVPDWLEEDLSRLESHLDYSTDLARHMTQAGTTVIAVATAKGKAIKSGQKATSADGSLKKSFLDGRDSGDLLSHVCRVASHDLDLPAIDLCEAALGLGHRLSPRRPGLSDRAHPILANYEGHPLPSFALRVAMTYLDLSPMEVSVGSDHLRLGNRRVPLYDGDLLVSPPTLKRPIPRISCTELLAGKPVPETVAGKIALVCLAQPLDPSPFGVTGTTDRAAHAASVVQTILSGSWIERPRLAPYFEMAALFFLLMLGTFFTSLKKEPLKGFTMLGLALVSLSFGLVTLLGAGIWVKTVHMAIALVLLYLAFGIRALFAVPALRRELADTHKLLGLHYRRQGELDQAFEEFRECRQDPEIKELLYDLGREYEKNAMLTQALRSYEAIRDIGQYKDVDERIARLGATGKPLPFKNGEPAGEKAVLPDSFVKMNKAVGRYQIISELGKGTMGVVYKAKDPKINRFVAVKVIRFSDDFDDEVLQEVKNRFLREAEIAGQLSHPSIITVFDVGEDQDLTYMAMECLEGKSLSHYCRKESLLPVSRVVEIVENIAGALDHAHKAKVIHRDIKPANIMILSEGGVKVTDFGIAKAISSSLTKTGIVLGTPNYMSPEQIMGHRIGPKTDIFSLGVVFFNLVTGELPFRGEKLNTLLYQITQAKHPSVRSINSSLPKAVEQIIDKALAKDPDHRFKSAGEMAKYLGMLRNKIDQTTLAASDPGAGSTPKAH